MSLRRLSFSRPETIFVLVVVVAVALATALAGGGTSPRSTRPAWMGDESPNARTEAANEAREAKFNRDHGGEADREGPKSPAAEQVGDRAYPRSYVDDKLARRSGRAFRELPSRPTSVAGRTGPAGNALVSGSWKELGPSTPNVPGPSSQFFDPTTLTGPTTQESGRVTALAIDPACSASSCRLWVAAAGGGIWRTDDALAAHPTWIAPPDDLPTYAFGSLLYDASNHVLYAGSGEPNGSGDSEAGLGLYKSTDFGASWSLVPGSAAVATNRSIGAIAVDPNNPNTIYIGTDVARHGSSAVNGGRMTPPDAPALGLYKSTDGGATFSLLTDLANATPPSPNPASSGVDWFQGGINKIEFDPTNHSDLYAAVLGYGVWRSTDNGATWSQVFHTMNQNDFSDPQNPVGDSVGDRTEFDLVPDGSGHTMAYLGDASDDFVLDGDAATPLPEAWRVNSIDTKSASSLVGASADNSGWTMLSDATNGTSGFGVYGFCQNGQCGYDEAVAAPNVNSVWFLGSMNYDELPAYDQLGTGAPPRSNGRAVVRSTNPTAGNSSTAKTTVSWNDMTAVLSDPSKAWGVQSGQHPDLHAIAFANNGNTAFIGSDGGVVRIDASSTQDQSASCAQRTYQYAGPDADATPLQAADLADCQSWLSAVPAAVTPINDGLRTLQFQSVSSDPNDQNGNLLGGTQDNGTWSLQPPSTTGLETVGGDGGQSGFDAGNSQIDYHNYYDATTEVNFHGNDPTTWLDIYDNLQISGEARSFYVPFAADPKISGTAYVGMQHVWRTTDNGGNEQDLIDNGCLSDQLDPFRANPCGDFTHIGRDLTGPAYGNDREGQYIVALTRAPSDDSTMWAATRTGRVFVSKNVDAQGAAVQFFRIDTATNSPNRFVSGIAVDPNNPNHAWVSYSGYSAYAPGGHVYDVVYDPTTHNATFTDISHNLPDMPVTGVAEDEASGAIFAATDFGVVELAPGADQWVTAGTGLPGTSVFALTIADSGRTLYAATHGRGVFSLALPAIPTAPTGAIHGPSVLELGKKAKFTATGSSTNGPVTFSWRLPGKPKTATGTPVTFVPTKLGVRTVVLTITDSAGKSTVVTQAVKVKDTRGPTISIHHIKTVHRGSRTAVSGRVTDVGGVRSAQIRFGDGSHRRLHLSGTGRFTVHHRYAHTGTYHVKVRATDRSGNTSHKTKLARVVR